jgi:hypothetical protein
MPIRSTPSVRSFTVRMTMHSALCGLSALRALLT